MKTLLKFLEKNRYVFIKKLKLYTSKCYKSLLDCIWVTATSFVCLPVLSTFSAYISLLQLKKAFSK